VTTAQLRAEARGSGPGGSQLQDRNDESLPPSGEQGLPAGASLYAAFLCILFGANAVAIKFSLAGLGMYTNAGLRFIVASIAVLLWARFTGRTLAISWVRIRQLIPLGIIFSAQLAFFYAGLIKTTASHCTLISNLLPFVVMVLAHFFIPGDRISLKKTSGLVLGFAGVLVLLSDSVMLSGDILAGDMLVLLAVLVWGCNAVYSKRIIKDFQPFQITLYPMLMSVPFFVSGMLLFDDPMVRHVDTPVIASMLYQTFVTASFGMVAWSSMIKKYGATAVHSFVFIMPVSGVFFGIVLLDEPLTINLVASIVLVTAGLVVLNRKRRKIAVVAIEQPIRSDKEQSSFPNHGGEV